MIMSFICHKPAGFASPFFGAAGYVRRPVRTQVHQALVVWAGGRGKRGYATANTAVTDGARVVENSGTGGSRSGAKPAGEPQATNTTAACGAGRCLRGRRSYQTPWNTMQYSCRMGTSSMAA